MSETMNTPKSPHTFLDDIYRLHTYHKTDQALDMIFQWVDEELKAGRSEKVDRVLKTANVEVLSEDLLVGLLSATFTAKQLLPEREHLGRRIRLHLAPTIGEHEAENLLNEFL